MAWYFEVLRKYAVFAGRAHRREYWMFLLVGVTIGFAIQIFEHLAALGDPGVLTWCYWLAMLPPTLAVSARRLHDTGRATSGLLLYLIPVIGWAMLVIRFTQPGQPHPNQYGPTPGVMASAG